MFSRNKLVHWVIWPYGKEPRIELIDVDGVVAGSVVVSDVVNGSDLARKVPDGCAVDFIDCAVFSMSGQIKVGSKGEFDTAVSTERKTLSVEERMSLLERRETRREQREKRLREENRRLQKERQEREARERELVVEDPPAPDPERTLEPQAAPESREGGADE